MKTQRDIRSTFYLTRDFAYLQMPVWTITRIILRACLEKIESKPFSMDFDIQLEGRRIIWNLDRFNFNIEDVNAILDSVDGMYSEEICNRIRELLRYQIRKYSYLIKK